jgi:transcriptional regulator of acetoin/glycerol metabolism
MPVSGGPIRPVVYESWRRSRLQGLMPDTVEPGYHPDLELDSYLTRAVAPMVQERAAAIEQARCVLTLTDGDGRLLRRWAPDRVLAGELDALGVAPHYSVAESDVGTTSAIALLNGSPVLVRGPEHFAENFRAYSCAGAPIVHPVNRRTVGTLNVTCRFADTSPFVLAWVTDLVREAQEALRDTACRREQLLLRAYLAHNRDARHPVVTLDQNTVISNAAATRLLGSADQAVLWEHASRAISEGTAAARVMTLVDGVRVSVQTHPVTDGPDTVGAVLTLKKVEPEPSPSPGRADGSRAVLPGLVGVSARWTELCAAAGRVEPGGRVLLVGEPGSGRTAVARALAGPGPTRVLDVRHIGPAGRDRWLGEVETELDGPEETVILRHVDLLDPALGRLTDAALARRPSGRRVFATSEARPLAPGQRCPLMETFTSVLEVPALRERPEDLPALLTALTARVVGGGPPVRWMPDAVQTLSRLDWPGNVAALEALVRRLVAHRRGGGYVGAGDLPTDVVAGTARRRLAALEQAEAQAILEAMRAAGGNKQRAAESLGIARSTLYRKVRALGLDLSATAF